MRVWRGGRSSADGDECVDDRGRRPARPEVLPEVLERDESSRDEQSVGGRVRERWVELPLWPAVRGGHLCGHPRPSAARVAAYDAYLLLRLRLPRLPSVRDKEPSRVVGRREKLARIRVHAVEVNHLPYGERR